MFVFAFYLLLVAQVYSYHHAHRQQDDVVAVHLNPPGQTLHVPSSVLKSSGVKKLQHDYAEAIREYSGRIVAAIADALRLNVETDYEKNNPGGADPYPIESGGIPIFGHPFKKTVDDVRREIENAVEGIDINFPGILLGPAVVFADKIAELEGHYGGDFLGLKQDAIWVYRSYAALYKALTKHVRENNPELATAHEVFTSLNHALRRGELTPGGLKVFDSDSADGDRHTGRRPICTFNIMGGPVCS